MIRYLAHHEIDKDKWDACIDSSLNGMIYAYSWYLDMVATPWGALVEDDYLSVMPLPYRKKWGIDYIYQPRFIQQLGVFSTTELSEEQTRRFLSVIPSRFKLVDICLNTFNRVPAIKGLELEKRLTHELNLIPSYEEIKKNYSTNVVRNLKKADRQEVFVVPHGRPEDLIDAFRRNRGRGMRVFSGPDYFVLKHLVYVGLHKGLVQLYSAYSPQNTFSAGIVFYRSHKKVILLFSGAEATARQTGAMFMLVDRFIRDHSGRELALDFEGSSDPGLARFYRGFGSKECVFLRVKINRLPMVLKPFAGAYMQLRKWVLQGG
ncbi:MAG: hypothetical protein R6U86_06210 [Bacteroidales bacterium]